MYTSYVIFIVELTIIYKQKKNNRSVIDIGPRALYSSNNTWKSGVWRQRWINSGTPEVRAAGQLTMTSGWKNETTISVRAAGARVKRTNKRSQDSKYVGGKYIRYSNRTCSRIRPKIRKNYRARMTIYAGLPSSSGDEFSRNKKQTTRKDIRPICSGIGTRIRNGGIRDVLKRFIIDNPRRYGRNIPCPQHRWTRSQSRSHAEPTKSTVHLIFGIL